MTSPLADLRGDIATLVEALTPPTETGRTYHEVDGRRATAGASGHRMFWLEPPTGGLVRQFAADMSVLEHRCELVLVLTTHGDSIGAMFDRVANEAVLIANAINHNAVWSNGVQMAQVSSYEREQVDEDRIALRFQLVALTQETD